MRDDLNSDSLIASAKAARALLANSGGLLLPYRAYNDGDLIRLECRKESVVALDDALKKAGF